MRRLPSLVLYTILFAFGSTIGIANAAPGYQKTASQAANIETGRNIQGTWQGILNSPVGKLRIVLKISKAADGALKATLDSPDQRAADLPVDTITFKDSYLITCAKDIERPPLITKLPPQLAK